MFLVFYLGRFRWDLRAVAEDVLVQVTVIVHQEHYVAHAHVIRFRAIRLADGADKDAIAEQKLFVE